MDGIIAGLCVTAIIIFLFRYIFGWYQYRKSIQKVIYSNYLEYFMKKSKIRKLSESDAFSDEFGKHRILFQLFAGKGQKTPRPYIIVILSSGMYCLKVSNAPGEIYGKKTGDWENLMAFDKKNPNKKVYGKITNPIEEIEQFKKSAQYKISKINTPVYKIVVFPDQCTLQMKNKEMNGTLIIKRSQLQDTLMKIHKSGENALNDWEIDALWEMIAKNSLNLEEKMKAVVAIDSFKGSLSSIEAGNAAREGILRARPDAVVIVKPLADGGEGTTDALLEGFKGEKVNLSVTGPMSKPVEAYYGYLSETNTVIMEMASAAGITLISESEKNPMLATTYGVGEMIRHAILRGYRNFIIGIGGSATNDGGIGMLEALGYEFKDKNGNDAGDGGQALSKVVRISGERAMKELKYCRFQIACDVNNPLYGANGATYVFGPQKGVTDGIKVCLDESMKNYARVSDEFTGKRCDDVKGAGAAGGLGFAFVEYLNAELIPGIELILKSIGLEHDIADADYVVTGEGRLDFQTAMGKVPVGVARLAKKYNKKVIAFAGSVTKEAGQCNKAGIDAFFPIVRGVTTLENAMNPENAKENMKDAVEQVFRLLP